MPDASVDDHVAEERLSGSQTGTLRYYNGPGVDDWLGRSFSVARV